MVGGKPTRASAFDDGAELYRRRRFLRSSVLEIALLFVEIKKDVRSRCYRRLEDGVLGRFGDRCAGDVSFDHFYGGDCVIPAAHLIVIDIPVIVIIMVILKLIIINPVSLVICEAGSSCD